MTLFKLEKVNFKEIVSYPDLEIEKGKVTFIAGESGTGKSTLFKLLNGVFTPTAGEITYEGEELSAYDSIELRRKNLLVGQSAVLFEEDSIKENFLTFFDYRDLEPLSEEEMVELLTLCSIDMPLNKEVYHLSGGEKQRVFIAIHLALGFEVLMLDEPTSALDAKNAHTLLSNVKAYCEKKGKTLLVISHDQEMVNEFADNVITLGGET